VPPDHLVALFGTIRPGDTVLLNDGATVTGDILDNGTLQFNRSVVQVRDGDEHLCDLTAGIERHVHGDFDPMGYATVDCDVCPAFRVAVSLPRHIDSSHTSPSAPAKWMSDWFGATHPEIPSLNEAPEKSASSGNWAAAKQACVDQLPEEAVKKTSRPKSEGGMH
jgi:hypothetical protein